MHELSIALGILDIAGEEARRQGGGRVVAIHLKLGPLSGVVPEALRSAFELARETSDLETAELVIEQTLLTAYCPACRTEATLASPQHLCCPECGGTTPQIVGGRELEIHALEIET